MRVLVVGTVPPPGGPAAARLGSAAAALAARGDAVEVLSPDERSAAHRHARLDGVRLAVQVARRARRFDALVLAIEPGLPLGPDDDRLTRALSLAALGLACRGFRHVTVRFASPIPVPGGVGGRASEGLWARADELVVESDDDRDQLLAVPGCRPERVRVEVPERAGSGAAPSDWSSLPAGEGSGELRARVQALVRVRAAQAARLDATGRALGSGSPGLVRDPFAGAAPRLGGPGARDVVRVVLARLVREVRARVGSAGRPRS